MSLTSPSAIRTRFQSLPTTEAQRAAIESLRASFVATALLVAGSAPESREVALALTDLESASHWAVRAVCVHGALPVTAQGTSPHPEPLPVGWREIELIAAIAHEANRAYCLTTGDDSQPHWEAAPDWQRQSAVNGVEAIAEGRVTTPEQAHESWMAEKLAGGWVYGPVKDPIGKTHPCLVPYAQLPAAQRRKDTIYFAIVTALLRAVAA